MSVHDDLSRLLEGDCTPSEREALLARIEQDPEAKALWAQLGALPRQFDALLHTPPPPHLDAALLARESSRQRPSWRPWIPLLLAAALLLWALWPQPPAEILLAQGVQQLSGHLLLRAGDTRIELDGIAEISVEPAGEVPRVTGAGGELVSRRKIWMAAGAGALVTVVLYEGTAVVWAEDEPQTLQPGERVQVGTQPPDPAVPQAPGPVIPDRIAALEAENALLKTMLEQLETEYRGTPIPWPADLPEALTPAGFERNVRAALEQCAPDVELLGFECQEPPCFALLRPSKKDWWGRLVNQCPAWVDHYTNSVASASGSVQCEDGREEVYHMLGWSSQLLERELSEEERENQSKRFDARIDELRSNWKCQE
jgi:hypothetical protein